MSLKDEILKMYKELNKKQRFIFRQVINAMVEANMIFEKGKVNNHE